MFFENTRQEIIAAAGKPHLWALLAWYDIKQRYRRSVLGPFWLTISTAVLIGTLGLLWSTLFKMNLSEYMPYFAAGNIIWTFVASQITEATTGFTQFEHLIKQTRLPYPSYLLRLLCRNLIIFMHNFVIIVAVVMLVGSGWHWVAFLAIPGMALLAAVTLCISFICAILCTRYRDMVPVIQNLVTVAYFLTPIMWQTRSLPERYQWASEFNPLSHLLDIARMPLLGQSPPWQSWVVSFAMLVVFAALGYALFARTRHRISYWI